MDAVLGLDSNRDGDSSAVASLVRPSGLFALAGFDMSVASELNFLKNPGYFNFPLISKGTVFQRFSNYGYRRQILSEYN